MTTPSPSSQTTFNPSTGPIVPRLVNAILLRREFYDAVANDSRATGPAAAIVCIAALARESVSLYELSQEFKAWGLILILIVIFAMLRWLVYATVMYPAARLIAGRSVEYKRLLRCLGFAETPAMLFLIAYVLPDQLHPLVQYGVTIWLLLATIVAVRSATGTTTQRAAAIGIVGFLAYMALGALTYAAPVVEPPAPDDPAALTLRGTL